VNFKSLLRKVTPYVAFLFYRTLLATWKVEIHESDDLKRCLKDGSQMVYAHWHGDELGLVFLLPRYRASAIVSTSADGEIMDKVVHLLGATTSRGSSTRGGVSAIRGILRLAKDGIRPSVAIDGPKGPRHKAKPGVFEIAKLTGGEIFPLTVTCSKAWTFHKSWNKAYLPKPFARLVVVWGPALPTIPRDVDAHDPSLASRLEIAMAAAEQQARRILAGT
jgi:lysophospholipid acyltransferase (LPLAT)-like uncharacterized protein